MQQESRPHHPLKIAALAMSVLAYLLLPLAVYADNTGTINYLQASGENPVSISTELRVIDGQLKNTSLRFFIRDSQGNIVHTHGPVAVPDLEMGLTETFPYSWQWTSPGLGDHTVEACWSPGTSTNCQLAQSTTSFQSVASLGSLLTAAAVVLVAAWFGYTGFKLRKKGTAPQ